MEDKKDFRLEDPPETIAQPARQAIDHTLELLGNMQAVQGDIFVLKVDEPNADTMRHIAEHIRTLSHSVHKPIFVVPKNWDFVGLGTFGFDLGLSLLQAGYKIQRIGWDGYLYIKDSVIYHSADNKEWIPTQHAMLAHNWKRVQ